MEGDRRCRGKSLPKYPQRGRGKIFLRISPYPILNAGSPLQKYLSKTNPLPHLCAFSLKFPGYKMKDRAILTDKWDFCQFPSNSEALNLIYLQVLTPRKRALDFLG